MCLSHDNLFNFYKLNFALAQYHKYSFSDIETMLPFEREIYVSLLINFLEEENKKNQNRHGSS